MRTFEDSFRHKGLRKKLIEVLKTKNITSEAVLNAINEVPRHFFIDSAFDNIAYEDRAFPIASGQTISQPYTVAFQTQLLDIKKGEKVLEIGTGSVFQACVLAALGARVFTIERQRELYLQQQQLFKEPNFYLKNKFSSIKFFCKDGFEGLPTFAPFDKIIITAAAPIIPPKLVEQLKVGGSMIIPLQEPNSDAQRMMRLTKQASGEMTVEKFDLFAFVPMLTGVS